MISDHDYAVNHYWFLANDYFYCCILYKGFTMTTPQADSAEIERMRDRIARIGLDIDRALRGEVNTQSPVGALRLQAIADLSRGSTPRKDP